jgi:hypothetical protein
LDLVYKAIVTNLIYPQTPERLLEGYDKGIEAVIKAWYRRKYDETSKSVSGDALKVELNSYATTIGTGYRSVSFRNGVKNAFLSLLERKDDDFTIILQWLMGENPPRNSLKNFGIFEKIDRSTAFNMIRCLVQWLREIGYAGLIVLMDEAEIGCSMSSRNREALLTNLRELIDECGHTDFKNTMFFYAVPDEQFLNGRQQIYEALRQRLSTVFDNKHNPRGVKIDLTNILGEPDRTLFEIGVKLSCIYETAYNVKFDKRLLNESIKNIAKAAYDKKLESGYMRLFVKSVIHAFDRIPSSTEPISMKDAEHIVAQMM